MKEPKVDICSQQDTFTSWWLFSWLESCLGWHRARNYSLLHCAHDGRTVSGPVPAERDGGAFAASFVGKHWRRVIWRPNGLKETAFVSQKFETWQSAI